MDIHFNHLTLAVTDLARSFHFYTAVLGLQAHARWDAGAYLGASGVWLCLSLDPTRTQAEAPDYTHYAFGVSHEAFAPLVAQLHAAGVLEWKSNRSEGESFYFLDPDGHRLELHMGDLHSRLAACRATPYAGMVFY